MFNEPRQLIIVYKDELALNFMRKLIETNDDKDETIVGTRDKSVKVISWDEKMWLDNKKAGNINAKVLFIGNVKWTDKLLPLIDVKYNKWGIKYGWAGKQAIIVVDESAVKDRKFYERFLEDFSSTTEKNKFQGINLVMPAVVLNPRFGLLALCAKLAVDYFKDKKKVRQQLYIHGIRELYLNHLETFMQL